MTSILQACIECDVFSTSEQIMHIIKRLPEEYAYGMDIEQYTTVGALERSLKGRHLFASRSHRDRSRKLMDCDTKRNPSQSPEGLRFSSDGRNEKRVAATLPRSPCNECGSLHWKTGPFAVACPPEVKRRFQESKGGYVKRETVHLIDDEDIDTPASWSDAEELGNADDDGAPEESFYDSEAYLVDFSRHGKLIDFDTKSYTGVYITEAPGKTPSRKSNKVIRAKALGPLAGQHSYKHYTNQHLLVRTSDSESSPKWRPADTCSPMNFVSRQYLDRHHPNIERSTKDTSHPDIAGVVKDASTKSTEGCWLKLYLPMVSGDDVLVEGYFHILDQFAPGLLFGQDMNVPYGFRFDSDREKYYIRGAGNAEGRLLVRRESRSTSNPVKVSHSMAVKPGHTCHVPISFKPFKGKDMLFTGKPFADSSIGEEGKAHGHLISDSTTQVRFSNLGNRPIKLKKGCIIGWIEIAPPNPICLFAHGIDVASPISSSINTAPVFHTDWPVRSEILSRISNPWRSPSTAELIANAKATKSVPCCRSKHPFVHRTPPARECERVRALEI